MLTICVRLYAYFDRGCQVVASGDLAVPCFVQQILNTIAGDELLAVTSGRNLERVHPVQRDVYNQAGKIDRVVQIRVQRVQNSRSQIEKVSFFEFMMRMRFSYFIKYKIMKKSKQTYFEV